MKASMWAIGLIIMGLLGIVFIDTFERITSNNDQNYYLVKEVTEASMYDAIDWGYYRVTGNVRIVGEKFMENFVRRYAQSVNMGRKYNIEFYDIIEEPPKVSLKVGSSVYITFNKKNLDIINAIDGIIESK